MKGMKQLKRMKRLKQDGAAVPRYFFFEDFRGVTDGTLLEALPNWEKPEPLETSCLEIQAETINNFVDPVTGTFYRAITPPMAEGVRVGCVMATDDSNGFPVAIGVDMDNAIAARVLSGVIQVYERVAGAWEARGTYGACSIGDTLEISYDDFEVTVYRNGEAVGGETLVMSTTLLYCGVLAWTAPGVYCSSWWITGRADPLTDAPLHYKETGIIEAAGVVAGWTNEGTAGAAHDLNGLPPTPMDLATLNSLDCVEGYDGRFRRNNATTGFTGAISGAFLGRFSDGQTGINQVLVSGGWGGQGLRVGIGSDNLFYAQFSGGVVDTKTMLGDSDYHVFQWERDAAKNGQFWIDGVVVGTFSGGDNSQFSVNFFSSEGVGGDAHGVICQYGMWSRQLTDIERAIVLEELQDKWYTYLTDNSGDILLTNSGQPLITG